MKDLILSFLSGGAGVAVIAGLFELLLWRKKRVAEKEDREEEKDEQAQKQFEETIRSQIERLTGQINALVESQKCILYDRIRYLGQKYIAETEIDFDDRRILNNMHQSYHCGLSGNGDLDQLMKQVNELPLRKNQK